MRYRIRYERGLSQHTAEVEAGSPSEAMVKFRHAKEAHDRRKPGQIRITSVYADEPQDEEHW